MLERIGRLFAFPLAIILVVPGMIQWVIVDRNIGVELGVWSVTGEWGL